MNCSEAKPLSSHRTICNAIKQSYMIIIMFTFDARARRQLTALGCCICCGPIVCIGKMAILTCVSGYVASTMPYSSLELPISVLYSPKKETKWEYVAPNIRSDAQIIRITRAEWSRYLLSEPIPASRLSDALFWPTTFMLLTNDLQVFVHYSDRIRSYISLGMLLQK